MMQSLAAIVLLGFSATAFAEQLQIRAAQCDLAVQSPRAEIPTRVEVFVDILTGADTRAGSVVLSGGDQGNEIKIVAAAKVSGLDPEGSRHTKVAYAVADLFGGEAKSYALDLNVLGGATNTFEATLTLVGELGSETRFVCKNFLK